MNKYDLEFEHIYNQIKDYNQEKLENDKNLGTVFTGDGATIDYDNIRVYVDYLDNDKIEISKEYVITYSLDEKQEDYSARIYGGKLI